MTSAEQEKKWRARLADLEVRKLNLQSSGGDSGIHWKRVINELWKLKTLLLQCDGRRPDTPYVPETATASTKPTMIPKTVKENASPNPAHTSAPPSIKPMFMLTKRPQELTPNVELSSPQVTATLAPAEKPKSALFSFKMKASQKAEATRVFDYDVLVTFAPADHDHVEREVVGPLIQDGLRIKRHSGDDWPTGDALSKLISELDMCHWVVVVATHNSPNSRWVTQTVEWAVRNRPGLALLVVLRDFHVASDLFTLARLLPCINLQSSPPAGRIELLKTLRSTRI